MVAKKKKKSSALLLNRSCPAVLLLTQMCLTDKVIVAGKNYDFKQIGSIPVAVWHIELSLKWPRVPVNCQSQSYDFPMRFAVKSVLQIAKKHWFHWEFVCWCRLHFHSFCCTRTLTDMFPPWIITYSNKTVMCHFLSRSRWLSVVLSINVESWEWLGWICPATGLVEYWWIVIHRATCLS